MRRSKNTWDRLCSCGKTFRCSGQLCCSTCRKHAGGGERELPKQDPPDHAERVESHRQRVQADLVRLGLWKETT